MIITKNDFCAIVEERFASTDETMIESVLNTCEYLSIDPDLVEPFINRSLREKLKLDYIKLNYLKAENNVIV